MRGRPKPLCPTGATDYWEENLRWRAFAVSILGLPFRLQDMGCRHDVRVNFVAAAP
jgi:hypothetical protein